jgi:hypothetical protein
LPRLMIAKMYVLLRGATSRFIGPYFIASIAHYHVINKNLLRLATVFLLDPTLLLAEEIACPGRGKRPAVRTLQAAFVVAKENMECRLEGQRRHTVLAATSQRRTRAMRPCEA